MMENEHPTQLLSRGPPWPHSMKSFVRSRPWRSRLARQKPVLVFLSPRLRGPRWGRIWDHLGSRLGLHAPMRPDGSGRGAEEVLKLKKLWYLKVLEYFPGSIFQAQSWSQLAMATRCYRPGPSLPFPTVSVQRLSCSVFRDPSDRHRRRGSCWEVNRDLVRTQHRRTSPQVRVHSAVWEPILIDDGYF